MTSTASAVESRPSRANYVSVIPAARFDRPLLRLIVHVNDSESLRVAVTPLEVVEQRPDVVTTDIYTLSHCFSDSTQVPPQVVDPLRII